MWEGNGICKYRKSPPVRKGRRWLIAMPVQFSQDQRQSACTQHSQPSAGGKPTTLHSASALQRQMGSKISTTAQKTSSKVIN